MASNTNLMFIGAVMLITVFSLKPIPNTSNAVPIGIYINGQLYQSPFVANISVSAPQDDPTVIYSLNISYICKLTLSNGTLTNCTMMP